MILFQPDDRKSGMVANGLDERASVAVRGLVAVNCLRRITQHGNSAIFVQRVHQRITEGLAVSYKVLGLIDEDVLKPGDNIKNERILAHN